jgi:hypothetical protein
LSKAVERVRERMALVHTAAESPLSQPPARGSFVQQLLRAADRDWTAQYDHTLRMPDPSPASANAARLMLIGSTPATEQLHEAVEAQAANIVATLNAQTPYRQDYAAPAGDAYESIARRCRAHPWRSMLHSPKTFCDRAKELHVDGVILWTIVEDTGLAWVCPPLERALRACDIEVLALTMQPWEVSPQTLETIANFVGTLRARA